MRCEFLMLTESYTCFERCVGLAITTGDIFLPVSMCNANTQTCTTPEFLFFNCHSVKAVGEARERRTLDHVSDGFMTTRELGKPFVKINSW